MSATIDTLSDVVVAACDTAADLQRAAAGPQLAREELRVPAEWLERMALHTAETAAQAVAVLEPFHAEAISNSPANQANADPDHVAILRAYRDQWGESAFVAAACRLILDGPPPGGGDA